MTLSLLYCVLPNPLNASFTKWSDTLKQFVSNWSTQCLSVFDYFMELALKGLMSVICQKRTSESKKNTQYTRLKRNAYYEIFNTFFRRNQVQLDWKDILLVVEVPPWVSPLCLVPEKIIWHLALSGSPGKNIS